MNVFKKKPKVAKERQQPDSFSFLDNTSEPPAVQSKFSRSLKRKQKNVVAPKPVFNLDDALPQTNDFRTSLMMPQLSARFSMLREQDDPTTKVGKANDDSVLFPKRASRMNLFSHNPLTDIAEVESIRSSFRPPFASPDRPYSVSDGYNSDDGGSMMSRSRPGEGNNLFGGRQKLYRVAGAGGSTKNLTEGERARGAMGGKHVYGDDVSASMFQQLRAQAREERERNEAEERPKSLRADEHGEADTANSPSTPFSKNRGTTSSTTSGPSNRRTSTAATSIDSESPIPRQNSTHNQGYSSKARTSDANGSVEEIAMKRNPSSESRRGLGMRENYTQPPLPTAPVLKHTLSQSRSAANLGDKYSRPGPFSANTLRTVSPPPTSNSQAMASLDFGLSESLNRANAQARRYQTASPTGQGSFEDEESEIYTKNLQPNDRGKATAMGLFNRPAQQFDEQQFLQRQRQMHEGRTSSFSAESRSESRSSPELSTGHTHENLPSPVQEKKYSVPEIPVSSPSLKATGMLGSSTPNLAPRPRNQSTAASTESASAIVKARVESLIRRQNAELAALEAERNVPSIPKSPRYPSEGSQLQEEASRGTFFNNFDASEDEVDDSPPKSAVHSVSRFPPADIHPALRNGTNDFSFGDDASTTPQMPYRRSDASNFSVPHSFVHGSESIRNSGHKQSDSPTLGPASGLGLSGMIRTHLRNDSDKSSILPPSPRQSQFQPSVPSRGVSMASTARTVNPPESVHSDPWEFEGAVRTQKSPRLGSHPSDTLPSMSQKAQQIFGHAAAQRNQGPSKAQQILGNEAPNGMEEQFQQRSWQDELAQTHKRGASTETQKEREDFDNELAERRRRILNRVAEGDQRSATPAGGKNERQNFPAQAMSALRHKTSKSSLGNRPNDTQPKAMRMLGISGGQREDMSVMSPNPGVMPEHEGENARDDPAWPPRQRPPPPVEPYFPNGRRTPGGNSDYANGRRTPAEGRRTPGDGRRTPGDGRHTPGDGRHTPGDGRHTPGDGRHAPGDGRRTPGEGRRTPGDGRHTPGGSRPQYGNPSHEEFERGKQRSATPSSRRERTNSEAAERSKSRNGRYREEDSYPPREGRQGSSRSPPDMDQRRPSESPQENRYERSASAMSSRARSASRGEGTYYDVRAPPVHTMPTANAPIGLPRPSPRPPVPQSPISAYPQQVVSPALSGPASAINSALSSPVVSSHPGTLNERSAPGGSRKKSLNKTMISEPTFISSTSSVPLVGLPAVGPRSTAVTSPPVPAMNPRRRGNTGADQLLVSGPAQPSPQMPITHDSSYPNSNYRQSDFSVVGTQPTYSNESPKAGPRSRNRLRKTSSEGGNMAARARQQALMMEMGREKDRSPAVQVFPNRSATSLGMAQEGGMF